MLSAYGQCYFDKNMMNRVINVLTQSFKLAEIAVRYYIHVCPISKKCLSWVPLLGLCKLYIKTYNIHVLIVKTAWLNGTGTDSELVQ